MGKKTITDIDASLDRWHRKLSRAVTQIDKLRAARKRIIKGKVKSPLPEDNANSPYTKREDFGRTMTMKEYQDFIESLPESVTVMAPGDIDPV